MDNFEQKAKSWDLNPRVVKSATNFTNEVLLNIDKNIKNFNVLDYGTGSGLVALLLQDKVKHITGLDNSKSMLKELGIKIEKLKIENIDFSFHDINHESLHKNKFDLVVTNMTMHHIKNHSIFISKLFDSLKIGGYLFIADLQTEDGSFHSNNQGVEHFGFQLDDIKNRYEELKLDDIKIKVYQTIDKNDKSYNVFIASGQKV
jgi:ubiquinone/menaquinone biosynthesis C-methylase UbiE